MRLRRFLEAMHGTGPGAPGDHGRAMVGSGDGDGRKSAAGEGDAFAINASLASIKDKTVTITTVHRTVGIAGARAFGGPVGAGNTYLVGERGPEHFTPNVSGYVSPGAGGGGGGTQPIIIKNTVHLSRREVTTAVAEDVFREVRRRVGG